MWLRPGRRRLWLHSRPRPGLAGGALGASPQQVRLCWAPHVGIAVACLPSWDISWLLGMALQQRISSCAMPLVWKVKEPEPVGCCHSVDKVSQGHLRYVKCLLPGSLEGFGHTAVLQCAGSGLCSMLCSQRRALKRYEVSFRVPGGAGAHSGAGGQAAADIHGADAGGPVHVRARGQERQQEGPRHLHSPKCAPLPASVPACPRTV